MDLKTVLGRAALAFVLWFKIAGRATAAHIVRNIGAFLSSAAHGFSTFLTSL